MSALLFSAGAFAAQESTLPSVDRRVPRDRKLRAIYDCFLEFRSDRALAQLAPLIAAKAKSGLRSPKDRQVMARLLSLAGSAYFMDENLIAGLNMFRIAHKLCPDDLLVTCYLANAYREVPDFNEEKKLVTALESLPQSKKTSLVYVTLARHEKRFGRLIKAVENLEKAEKLDTDKRDAALQVVFARTLIFKGCGRTAADRFKLAAARTENNYMREIMLANAALVMMDDAAQEAHLKAAGKIYPFDPIWHLKLAELYFGSGRENVALTHLQDALNSKRFSGNAYMKCARYFWIKKKFDKALQAVQRFEDLSRRTGETAVVRAEIEDARGDKARAEEFYKQALKLDPMYTGAYEGLAKFYTCKAKKPSAAIELAKEFVNVMPSYWAARFLNASCLMYAKDLVGAQIEAETALKLLSDEPEENLNLFAMNQAGRAHAIAGTKYYIEDQDMQRASEEAIAFNRMKFNPDLPAYLKIVVLRPSRLKFDEALGLKDPMVHAAMADMLLETQCLNQSATEYKKALALAPDNQEFRSYLMHVLSQNGDWGAAARENLAFSQGVVNSIPSAIEEWTGGKKKKDTKTSQSQ